MISRLQAELTLALCTTAFGIITMIGSAEHGISWTKSGPEAGTFPFYVGAIISLASLGNMATAFLATRRSDEGHSAPFMTRDQMRLVAGFALPILAFVIVSLWLGLYVGMALYMFGTLVFQNGYSLARASIIALAIPLCTYLLIERIFKVGILKGPLEAALGF